MKKMTKILIILGLMVGIVAFWIWHRDLGVEGSTQLYLTGGGLSLTAFAVLYKLLGSFDVIPDWIPILGSLDDMVAWVGMLAGLGVAAVGWHFF